MSQKERTVVYYIDDLEALRRSLLRDGGLTEKQADSLTENLPPSFRAVYTLYGFGKTVDRYTLTEWETREKIPVDALNPYQHSILYECMAHFEGTPLPDGKIFPTGVVCIQGDGASDRYYMRPSQQGKEEQKKGEAS